MARGRGGARGSTRGSRSRGRGSSRGRGGPRPYKRPSFVTSRLAETEDDVVSQDERSAASDNHEDSLKYLESETEDSASDEDAPTTAAYQALMQTLSAKSDHDEPARKKRKVSDDYANGHVGSNAVPGSASTHGSKPEVEEGKPETESLDDESVEHEPHSDASDDEEDLKDPFESHYVDVDEAAFTAQIGAIKSKKWQSNTTNLRGDVRVTSAFVSISSSYKTAKRSKEPSFKRRLSAAAARIQGGLNATEMSLAEQILAYGDVLCGFRRLHDPSKLRDFISLHTVNQVFKTRDRVIKNNAKLAQEANSDVPDLRDQGFTRPKVLVLLPTRQSCVRWIESITQVSEPEQQENKSRLLETYSAEDETAWDEKPADFQELFAGNIDDDFRIGMKFTRKTVKYFSSFYNSDIILASALGLMRAIEGADGKDKNKSQDADFLSSIEIVVIDHANAILMQNWQHVETIFSQLNLLPKESHGCDFSRVRSWYLDGNARYLRQTIILSDYLTPELNSLVSSHTFNIAGRIKYTPTYRGAMLDLPPNLPLGTLTQTFSRFHSPTPLSDPDARFTHFTSTILPTLLKSHSSQAKGTLIFIPTYDQFLRLRNHLSTSLAASSLPFASISEYTPPRDIARARSHFLSGRHSVLLYTERAHHFRRLNIKGVKKLVFYGVPENPIFWSEIVGFLGLNTEFDGQGGQEKIAKGAVRALFSKWDILKLERIVGTERVAKLVNERGGDVFDFI